MRTITFPNINITLISKVKVVLIDLGKTLIIYFLKSYQHLIIVSLIFEKKYYIENLLKHLLFIKL